VENKTIMKNKNEKTSNELEKERLELIDKRVEIQKKRIEVKKERLCIDELIARRNIDLMKHRQTLDNISELRNLLSDITIDPERTILGSEPFLTTTFVGEERQALKEKLMELIKKI
jgi:hypothetical protein